MTEDSGEPIGEHPGPVPGTGRPEEMRALVRAYVAATHATYLDQVAPLPPGERAGLPMLRARRLTVVAAAAIRLHLIATTDALPAPQGPEVVIRDHDRDLDWDLRFYDPSLLPALGLLADDSPLAVRQALGIADTVYHLTVALGGGLESHDALHSGVALAHQHQRAARDVERLRRALPRQVPTVDELADCTRLGLDRAAGLLAADLTAGRVTPPAGTPADDVLADVVRDVLAGGAR